MGNWYTWGAATANTAKNATSNGTKATDSICPAGWQLPDNDGTKSYYNLATTTYGIGDNSTSSTKLRSSPLSFAYAGVYNFDGGVSYVGSRGYYWSSTAGLSDNAYNLYFNSSNVAPQNNAYRGFGFSVRCVVR